MYIVFRLPLLRYSGFSFLPIMEIFIRRMESSRLKYGWEMEVAKADVYRRLCANSYWSNEIQGNSRARLITQVNETFQHIFVGWFILFLFNEYFFLLFSMFSAECRCNYTLYVCLFGKQCVIKNNPNYSTIFPHMLLKQL